MSLDTVGEAFVKILPSMTGFAEKLTGELGGLDLGKVLGKAGLVLGLGDIAAKAINAAGQFQAAMERMHTMAQVPQSSVDALKGKVLALAGQVGEGPNSLADALYHIESSFQSTGITGQKAMELLQTAAEGARIGGANLTDVTNALDAAVVSGIPGVQDFHQAMGALMATVGSGDMQMQDLANALSTGVLAAVKQFGLSITDVGAALAVFGDNNIRGQVAATDLRMAVQDLAVQAKPGAKALESIGIASGQLGRDLASGGLLKALEDVKSHLKSAGVSAQTTGEFLLKAFTKKGGSGIAILLDQLDRLKGKYGDITHAMGGFNSAWAAAQATWSQKMAEIKAGAEALLVALGQKLIPVAIAALNGLGAAWGAISPYVQEVGRDIGKIASILSAGFNGAAIQGSLSPIAHLLYDIGKAAAEVVGFITSHWSQLAPVFAVLGVAIAATFAPITTLVVGLMLAYDHVAAFRNAVNAVAGFILSTVVPAVEAFARVVAADLVAAWHVFQTSVLPVLESIGKIAIAVFSAIGSWLAHIAADALKYGTQFYQFLSTVFTKLEAIAKPIWQAITDIIKVAFGVIKGLFVAFAAPLLLVWNTFHSTIVAVWTAMWNTVKAVFKGVWEVIIAFIHAVVGTISDVVNLFLDVFTGNWSDAWNRVKGIFTNIWNLLSAVVSAVIGVVMSILHGWIGIVEAFFSDLGGNISKAAAVAWHFLVTAAQQVIGDLMGVVHSIPGKITGAFGDAGAMLLQIGKHIIQGLINGIGSMAGGVASAIGHIASSIPGKIAGFLGIHSPSRVMHEIGTHIGSGLVNGITASAPAVSAAALMLAQAAYGAFQGQNTTLALGAGPGGAAGPLGGLGADLGASMAVRLTTASTAATSPLVTRLDKLLALAEADSASAKTAEAQLAQLVTRLIQGQQTGLADAAKAAEMLAMLIEVEQRLAEEMASLPNEVALLQRTGALAGGRR